MLLEPRATAGQRFRGMDDLRELDEQLGLDRVLILRRGDGARGQSRLLDGYLTWPLESRGVPVDVLVPEVGLVRKGTAMGARSRAGDGDPIGLGTPALAEIAYPDAGGGSRPLRRTDAGPRLPPWRVRPLARCEDTAPDGADAVVTLCPAEQRKTTSDLRLVVHGAAEPMGTPRTIAWSSDELDERVLILEFAPTHVDVVLTSGGHRSVEALRQRLMSRTVDDATVEKR